LATADENFWGGLRARVDALERERAARRAAEAVAAHASRGIRPRAKKRRAAAVATRA